MISVDSPSRRGSVTTNANSMSMLSSWLEFPGQIRESAGEQLSIGSQFTTLKQLYIDAVACGVAVVLDAIREGIPGHCREQRCVLAPELDRCQRQPRLWIIAARRQWNNREEGGSPE